MIIYSKNTEADKAFFRDVLNLTNVDAGHGWLIFGLPPSEFAVHPSEENDRQDIYLMCSDIKAFTEQMLVHQIVCSEIRNQGWDQLIHITYRMEANWACTNQTMQFHNN